MDATALLQKTAKFGRLLDEIVPGGVIDIVPHCQIRRLVVYGIHHTGPNLVRDHRLRTRSPRFDPTAILSSAHVEQAFAGRIFYGPSTAPAVAHEPHIAVKVRLNTIHFFGIAKYDGGMSTYILVVLSGPLKLYIDLQTKIVQYILPCKYSSVFIRSILFLITFRYWGLPSL